MMRAVRIFACAASLVAAAIPCAHAQAVAPGTASAPIQIVALGASQTYGKGVARGQDYPAQLEALLRAKGIDARIANEGIDGNTTASMLSRLDRAVPEGTRLVILQPGGNDRRKGRTGETEANVATIKDRLASRGIKVIMLENDYFASVARGGDFQHLTPEGYHALAEWLLPQVQSALAP